MTTEEIKSQIIASLSTKGFCDANGKGTISNDTVVMSDMTSVSVFSPSKRFVRRYENISNEEIESIVTNFVDDLKASAKWLSLTVPNSSSVFEFVNNLFKAFGYEVTLGERIETKEDTYAIVEENKLTLFDKSSEEAESFDYKDLKVAKLINFVIKYA